MRYTREQYYRIWLACVEGVGARSADRLIEKYGSAEAVWTCFGEPMRWIGDKVWQALAKARDRDWAHALFDRIDASDIRVVFREGAGYPPLLRTLGDAPPLLFVRGVADLSDPLTFAIVGARNGSSYGKAMTEEIAEAIAGAGVTVVSGFARGIDSAAHRGALKAGGRTIAVLGCGVDVLYPPENGKLLDELLESGGSLVSEYGPGMPPLSENFPRRNRLISGMSRGVLLAEAAPKSGAMITVEYALEQGREVFVLPGPANARLSEMPNRLAREGARVVTSAQELLEDLDVFGLPWANRRPKDLPPQLTAEEKLVYDALQDGEKGVDQLMERTGLSVQQVNSVLTMLGIQGIIEDTL
ncbi:MAG TPA: DNA-processing protein DprA [Clostridia bacterium]|nr:DNA-processing protein DprA [Clostridia bacterium]